MRCPGFVVYWAHTNQQQTAEMNNQNIASIILKQLGNNKFIAMTGAKQIYAVENGLQFKLPANFAKNKINFVVIRLNFMDLYDIEFGYIRGNTYKAVEKVEDVYCEDLQRIFTEITGLDTHL